MSENEPVTVIECRREEGHLVFLCPHCRREHSHGAGDSKGDGDGHRVAHCDPGSPFNERGYILREV